VLWLAAAAALHGQMAPEPADTLARARLKITATMQRLPKYICVQTIDRSYFGRVAAVTNASNYSCSQARADRQKGRASQRLDTTDRVRIDVAEVDGREIHLWTGVRRFETGDIDELLNRGPAGTGSFGGYLVDIFDNQGTQFNFVSQRTEGGRRIFAYTYRVAREDSGYKVRAEDHWVSTAYRGTFEIDAASLELLRITVDVLDLPKETGLCEAQSALEYASVRIGDSDFLLPRQSQLHTVDPGRLETNSNSVFTSCREYRAESVLSFGGADIPDASASAAKSRDPLLAGIRLTLRLDAGIDSDTAAGGDAVTARVVNPVRDPKSNAIVFRAGAVAHGRINRMEHWLDSLPRFVVGIHWDSMTAGEDTVPFNAIRDRNSEEAAARTIHTLQLRPMPVGPPDALVFPSVAKRYAIRAGYESQWTTVTPPAQRAPGAPRPPASNEAFAREMLAAHNAVRAAVQVPALAWSEKLAAVAQAWANTLFERRRFEHRPNSPYGENLFESSGPQSTPAEVTDDWATEADDYDYKANSCRGVCGHYTQLVWRGTREVGCAAAQGAGRQIVVCEYDPPGNRQGQRPW
jgi:pathogenesis-related protein 1